MPSQNKPATSLITGAVTDFLHYLNQLESPIVVGREYPPDRLVDAFKQWSFENNVSIKTIDRSLWQHACKQGHFRDEEKDNQ
jgi:hypothetical protein